MDDYENAFDLVYGGGVGGGVGLAEPPFTHEDRLHEDPHVDRRRGSEKDHKCTSKSQHGNDRVWNERNDRDSEHRSHKSRDGEQGHDRDRHIYEHDRSQERGHRRGSRSRSRSRSTERSRSRSRSFSRRHSYDRDRSQERGYRHGSRSQSIGRSRSRSHSSSFITRQTVPHLASTLRSALSRRRMTCLLSDSVQS